MSDDTIGYFRYAKSKSKLQLIIISVFSTIASIAYLIAVPFYIYYVATPVSKDIPKLIHNDYSYTEGTISLIQIEKASNIIYINGLKLYEVKSFLNGKLEQSKKYRIAYLGNTNTCVGFQELK